MKTRPYPNSPGSPPLKYTLRKKASEDQELAGVRTDTGGEDAASPQTPLRNATQRAASLPPGGRGEPLTLQSPGRASSERGTPAGRRPRRRQEAQSGHSVAGAAGCGGQERAAGPRGGTSEARRDRAAPQPRRIRVPLHCTHLPGAPPPPPLPPALGSRCAVSSSGHRDRPAAALPCPSLSVATRLPRAALHQPVAHGHGQLRRRRTDRRSTRAPPPCPRARARAPASRAHLPAALAPPREPLRPIPGLRAGRGRAGPRWEGNRRLVLSVGACWEAEPLSSFLRLPAQQRRCCAAVLLLFETPGGLGIGNPRQAAFRRDTPPAPAFVAASERFLCS